MTTLTIIDNCDVHSSAIIALLSEPVPRVTSKRMIAEKSRETKAMLTFVPGMTFALGDTIDE